MKKVKIVTDSACDLDLNVLEELDVKLIPLTVTLGEMVYEDRVTISTNEFYSWLKNNKEQPKTSQITPMIYSNVFKELNDQGYHVVSICFSSGLSGSYQSACVAKTLMETDEVDVFDSKAASVGFGLIVREAALMARDGKSAAEIIDRVTYMRDRMEHIFAVGNLEMLKRGGRISTAQAVMGNLLNVKPILQFEDGKIIPYDKVRGEKLALKKLIDTMRDRGYELENQLIGLNYSGSDELCKKIKEEITNNFGCKSFLISEIGAAIGSHVGEGTTSVFFMRK